MTEQERKQLKELYGYDRLTLPQLFLELAKLIFLLVYSVLRKIVLIIWRLMVLLFELTVEGLQWLRDWWNDNDTQEKVAKIKEAIKHGCIVFAHWCVIAAKATGKGIVKASVATWHGIVYAAKATVEGIIHLKPTVIRAGELIVLGTKATIAWFVRVGRGIKLFHIRRKRAYQRFRRNKGFKGLIIDSATSVRDGITKFMEEDQQEANPDAVTEDDILGEQLEERFEEGSKTHRFGKTFIKKVKSIVDE